MITRGLAALILTFIFSTTLFAEYLYKDEVEHNPDFSNEINGIGAELYKKTGIALYLVMVRDLEDNQSIVNYDELAAVLREQKLMWQLYS
jgi:hypothetical protein